MWVEMNESNGGVVFLNMEHIVAIIPQENGCKLVQCDGRYWFVQESVKDIFALMTE
jgi:hypothetical protein